MTQLREGLPHLPDRMKKLPLDHRGYPVPWFVAFIDGKPDFRVIRQGGIPKAYNEERCWLCGERRGAIGCFVIGPMCAVNRVSPEPPSHLECANFAAKACPFLTMPKAERREAGLDEIGARDPAGHMIKRNPGVTLLWTSRTWKPFRVKTGGFLFDVGDPLETWWFAQGRDATRAEVLDSINSGLPLLAAQAAGDPEAIAQLSIMHAAAMQLIPKE